MYLLTALFAGILLHTTPIQPVSGDEAIVGSWDIHAMVLFETELEVDVIHAGDHFIFQADGTVEGMIRGQHFQGDWMCDAANTWLSVSDDLSGTGFRFKVLYLNEDTLKVDYGYYEAGTYLHDILIFTPAE